MTRFISIALALLFSATVPALLVSCSKKTSEAERRANIQPSSKLPFQITVVETPESKEQAEIGRQAAALFKNQDYAGLDNLAAKYRASKESYADGSWKLMSVYDAITSPGSDSDSGWATRQQEIQAWISARPESVTARITMARLLRNYAWKARGSDWADTVSDTNGIIFGKRLNQAWAVLDDGQNLKEQCPIYWSTRLGIALGLQIDKTQYNEIFRRAIKTEPDFENYYNARAVFLLPRWYGEDGEWEKDLAQSADTIKGDDGDMLYAQVAWCIHHYGSSQNVFAENKLISWERVDRGFGIIEQRFPNSLAAKNERAQLAALAGDKEKAARYFKETSGKVDLSVWSEKGEFIDCANWAFGQ